MRPLGDPQSADPDPKPKPNPKTGEFCCEQIQCGEKLQKEEGKPGCGGFKMTLENISTLKVCKY